MKTRWQTKLKRVAEVQHRKRIQQHHLQDFNADAQAHLVYGYMRDLDLRLMELETIVASLAASLNDQGLLPDL